jgi:hypothetical protein
VTGNGHASRFSWGTRRALPKPRRASSNITSTVWRSPQTQILSNSRANMGYGQAVCDPPYSEIRAKRTWVNPWLPHARLNPATDENNAPNLPRLPMLKADVVRDPLTSFALGGSPLFAVFKPESPGGSDTTRLKPSPIMEFHFLAPHPAFEVQSNGSIFNN